MKTQRLLVMLTLVNLGLLMLTLARSSPTAAENTAPVLRGRALEIVDERGKVRASIQVLPASQQEDGDVYAETVLLRLITENGRPSAKLSASEQAALLALVGPFNTKSTYTQLGAKGVTSSLTLKDEDGREKVIEP